MKPSFFNSGKLMALPILVIALNSFTSCSTTQVVKPDFVYAMGDVIDLNMLENELIIDYPSLEIFIDTTASRNFQFVSSASNQSLFKTYPEFKNKDYSASNAYWIRLKVKSNSNSNQIWLAEFYDQSIDSIDMYINKGYGRIELVSFGDAYSYQQREFLHKNFHAVIPSVDGVQVFYFRVRSSQFADIRIALRTINRFVYYALNEYFLYGIFYGMILIICFYNIMMFTAITESKYIYYTIYLLCVAVYAMSVDGIAYQYLWPDWPVWNQYAASVFQYLLIISAIAFTRKFLRTRTAHKFQDKIFIWFIAARTVYFLISMWEGKTLLEIRIIEVLPLGFIFYTGIVSFMKGYKPARFFIIAYGVLFLGFIIKGLVYLNFIPFTIITYYSLHICFLFEMLFLTFSLADRVRILKGNRDRVYKRMIKQYEENAALREKVNLELEEKVAERTIEVNEKNRMLEETNQKLVVQSREINQINSLLDLDNWKLKNNLKEVLKDRVFPKRISFEEFREIFPDNISCVRYLSKLKWGKKYNCRKCNNELFFDGNKPYSRRCTRCGYDESVSSNTIFQGVKFPLNKAFYILYTIMDHEDKLTIDQLSEMLEMRRNTVWNFKKKVQTAIKAGGNKSELSALNWQNIMVDFGKQISHTKARQKQLEH